MWLLQETSSKLASYDAATLVTHASISTRIFLCTYVLADSGVGIFCDIMSEGEPLKLSEIHKCSKLKLVKSA